MVDRLNFGVRRPGRIFLSPAMGAKTNSATQISRIEPYRVSKTRWKHL